VCFNIIVLSAGLALKRTH